MSTFDSILVGGIGVGFLSIFIPLIWKKGTNAKKVTTIVAFLLFVLVSCVLAYHYNWESDILHISALPESTVSENYIPTMEHPIETTDQQVPAFPTTQSVEMDSLLGEAYELHTPNEGIAASVEFRKWDSSSDKDLRNNTYTDMTGECYYAAFSNMFNAIGGGGSEGDRIVSEIHIPINDSVDMDYSELYLVGSVVAEQRTQSSGAYADVAILIDGIEKWRCENHIKGKTVQPVEFAVSLEAVKSEVVIRTSCVPLDNGLALGFMNIDTSHHTDLNIQQSLPQDTPSEDGFTIVRAFETHSPDNNGVDFVEFRGWDSFSDADLRTEQYINKDGLFIKFSNTFSMLGSSLENQIESEIHLVINPKKELNGLVWTGLIVAEQRTQGSSAHADVVILVDGIEKWRTSESITGNTIAPTEFSIDLSDALYEVVIKTYCTANDNGLALGFVNMEFRYP